MVRLRLALVCTLGVLLLLPQSASGGGWWTYVDVTRSPVAPGQRVELAATVAFSSAAAAEAARHRFSVYLLRGFDDSVVERAMRKPSPGKWWSLGGAEAIEVGPVTVNRSYSNLARATAAFTVPELPPATYHLMLCDARCTEPLPDVTPVSGFTVVADPATARMAKRVDRLQRRSRSQAGQLAAARADTAKARAAARDARMDVERLEAGMSSLANRGSPPAAYFGWLVAGALAGALALVVLRRRRPPRPARVVGWRPSDEELRELLAAESRDPR
jgi:hypothetical protein